MRRDIIQKKAGKRPRLSFMDEQTLMRLLLAEQPKLLGYLRSIVRRADLAEDATIMGDSDPPRDADFHERVTRYLEGNLAGAELRKLSAELIADAHNRAIFVEIYSARSGMIQNNNDVSTTGDPI